MSIPTDKSPIVVAAMYKFVTLNDYESIQPRLLKFCQNNNIKGTLLLANEGINGTVSGSRDGIDNLLEYLKSDPRLADLEHKESLNTKQPFLRMKVKLKSEIVTLGVDGIDPNQQVGQYLKGQDWNDLIADPETIVIDTRNDYEVEIGTFKNAINPETETFREFPEYVEKLKQENPSATDKKVAMFCTGGIRCEKSTALMLQMGFKDVYHLKGGILKYIEDTPKEDSLWEGECFVFDERVAVDHDLNKGSYDQCHGCRYPITEEDKLSPKYLRGVHCPKCFDGLTAEKFQRAAERQKQIDLAKARGEEHLG